MSLLRVFISLLILSYFAYPESGQAELRNDLTELARSQVRSLSRAVTVFNYSDRSSLLNGGDLPPLPNNDRLRAKFERIRGRFLQPAGSSWEAAGPGLYAAIEPIYTLGFGGENWALTQIVMPEGTHYLDARDPDPRHPALTPEIIQGMMNAGCDLAFLPQPGLRDIFRYSTKPGCRKIRDELIEDLGITAIRYSYSTYDLSALCIQRQSESAIVIFDPSAIDWNRTVVLTHDIPNDNDIARENMLILNSIFGSAAPPHAGFLFQTPNRLWPQIGDHHSLAHVKAWAQRSLFDCGDFAENK